MQSVLFSFAVCAISFFVHKIFTVQTGQSAQFDNQLCHFILVARTWVVNWSCSFDSITAPLAGAKQVTGSLDSLSCAEFIACFKVIALLGMST